MHPNFHGGSAESNSAPLGRRPYHCRVLLLLTHIPTPLEGEPRPGLGDIRSPLAPTQPTESLAQKALQVPDLQLSHIPFVPVTSLVDW